MVITLVCVKVIVAGTQETQDSVRAYACPGEYRTHIGTKMLNKIGQFALNFKRDL